MPVTGRACVHFLAVCQTSFQALLVGLFAVLLCSKGILPLLLPLGLQTAVLACFQCSLQLLSCSVIHIQNHVLPGITRGAHPLLHFDGTLLMHGLETRFNSLFTRFKQRLHLVRFGIVLGLTGVCRLLHLLKHRVLQLHRLCSPLLIEVLQSRLGLGTLVDEGFHAVLQPFGCPLCPSFLDALIRLQPLLGFLAHHFLGGL
mmetsp:Transcript_27221/g.46219  ORF Transcript_27221/g.46219 Transcript_27221/m.46219 type:complete len:201 (-) Transcript_27221:866-1468(-)